MSIWELDGWSHSYKHRCVQSVWILVKYKLQAFYKADYLSLHKRRFCDHLRNITAMNTVASLTTAGKSLSGQNEEGASKEKRYCVEGAKAIFKNY